MVEFGGVAAIYKWGREGKRRREEAGDILQVQ